MKLNLPSQAVMLAPMAGFSDLAFRKLCYRFGCDMAFCEMVSAKGLFYSGLRSLELLKIDPSEPATGVQLFGSDPAILSEITKRLSDSLQGRIPCIDFNLGCPAPKITSNGDGSALLLKPELISVILRAMVSASSVPISVKMRLGWDERNQNYIEVARRIEDSGVSMLTVHGRTRMQLYGGRANIDAIAEIKRKVSIPVIANGDVSNASSALATLAHTGCDGIMIGRGALGRPYVFAEIKAALSGTDYTPPTEEEKLELALAHAEAELAEKGERGLIELRKHLPFFFFEMRGAAELRRRINSASTLDELKRILLDRRETKLYNK
ncbi:MAG: tRNA dihydrouridine synthase DusB [Clostridia bacterium]|nr:tRNA dihydrouridine synthase DusB [Clostridia bacterium]